MSRIAQALVLATAFCFGAVPAAHAFGDRLSSRQNVACCGATVTVVCIPSYAVLPVCVQPGLPARGGRPLYAVPRPAPPSKTTEPPLNAKPIIRESQAAPGRELALNGVCKVGFWNLSGREMSIRVNGARRIVPRERAIILDVSREFTWNEEGRQPTRVRVPPGKTDYDIVLR